MNYLKLSTRYNLSNDEIRENDGVLIITVDKDNFSFEDIHNEFSNLPTTLYVYSCILQEDGRETDEFIANSFDNFTKLSKIEYGEETKTFTISLIQPNLLEQRVAELEAKIAKLSE